jgi:predicted nuclease of predicted toxin-antitoxin system
VKLLLDENLSPAHAVRLRQAGHDAVNVLESGLGGAPDSAVRDFAMEQCRTLITLDSDFSHILRFPPEGTAGVIWLRPWPPTESAIAALLDGVVLQLADASIAGKLVVAEPGRIRIR